MRIVAIIAAGGRGERLGQRVPKQLLELGGRTILQRSVEALAASERIDEIIAVLPPEMAASPPAWLATCARPVRVVAGGPRRQDSVANGVAAIPDEAALVVIHDAARPFVTTALIDRTIDAALETGAAVAALPAGETVKQVEVGNGRSLVLHTMPRETIYLAQTPQAFRIGMLRAAIANGSNGTDATDEAVLVERMGEQVAIVPGERANLKITTPEDLVLAKGMVESQQGSEPDRGRLDLQSLGDVRAGTGYDLHRFVVGRPLILGGVTIPFDRGLLGHSDADALSHAVTDAILGAAAAGDIGKHFPDSDPRWKGASSLDLLARAVDLIAEQGYSVENVDAVIVTEKPTLAPYLDSMARTLAGVLRTDASRISIKGKTNEGMDAIGRGEALAVHAVALLKRTRT